MLPTQVEMKDLLIKWEDFFNVLIHVKPGLLSSDYTLHWQIQFSLDKVLTFQFHLTTNFILFCFCNVSGYTFQSYRLWQRQTKKCITNENVSSICFFLHRMLRHMTMKIYKCSLDGKTSQEFIGTPPFFSSPNIQ